MSPFNSREEKMLAQIADTGVAGATFTVKMYGKHLFLEMKSPHAVMTILNGNGQDIRKLRKALRKAEDLFNEATKATKEQVQSLTRSQTDLQVAKAKKAKEKPTKRKHKNGKDE